MPKYLLQVNYTAEGAKGLLKDGGTKRRQAATALVEGLGGKMEALYFAFGETDVFAIADLPDSTSPRQRLHSLWPPAGSCRARPPC